MPPRSPKDPSKIPAKAPTARKTATKPVKADPVAAPGATVEILKLKDLVDGVAATTGAKKPEVKKAVEATLAALAAALNAGAVLALPPLGKLRVVKTTATALTLKLRLASGGKSDALALAEPDQDS